jgi:RimJ/RimL family protein N-acetyltransferase
MTELQRLTGRGVFLRKLRLEDASERYVGWLNDPAVNRFLESRFTHWTLESVRDYIRAKQNAREHFFAICDVAGENHVGNIKLGPIDPHHRCADVSLFIGDTAHWGRGAGSEAIALVTSLAFDQLDLLKLQAGAYLANIGCIRAFERCGFSREGLLKERVLSNGVPDDVVMLGYAASEYRTRKSQ